MSTPAADASDAERTDTDGDAPPLVELRSVSRTYDRGRIRALDNISLSIWPGQGIGIAGPSGCGKSTLLNVIAGLDVPTAGSVRFAGVQVESEAHWSRLRATRIGMVFQSFHLLDALTALQNVLVPMVDAQASVAERRRTATKLLASVGLPDRLGHRPSELSGGERQRVAIARSLANGPELLLADEPTGNLDSDNAERIADLLVDLHDRRGMALVIATHDPALSTRLTRRITLLDGRIAADSEMGGR